MWPRSNARIRKKMQIMLKVRISFVFRGCGGCDAKSMRSKYLVLNGSAAFAQNINHKSEISFN